MRVHLSAPQGADLSVLRDVLTDLGAEIVPPLERDSTRWQPLRDWQGVDGAVVVLIPLSRGEYERILVELGIALGRQIPLLIFADHGVAWELYQVAKVAEMHGILLNPEALRFNLSLFLKSLSVSGEEYEGRLHDQVLPLDLEPFRSRLASIRQIPPQARSLKYEEWVADLFRAAGAELATPTDRDSRGFDFVVSMPDLDLKTGPLVVEVKRSSSPEALTNAALELQYLVLQERAGLGLLLYEDEDLPESFALQVVPRIVSLGFDDLVRHLEHESLADVVVQARNDTVHRL
jgi:hypothetical protein